MDENYGDVSSGNRFVLRSAREHSEQPEHQTKVPIREWPERGSLGALVSLFLGCFSATEQPEQSEQPLLISP
jgi:hypothetical protein